MGYTAAMKSLFPLLLCTLLALPVSAVTPGEVAPPIDLPVLNGNGSSLRLADLRGQVVYVDFWASWCGPCRLSLPALQAIYDELSAVGFTVLAVNVDALTEEAEGFMQRYPVSYPVLLDPDGLVPEAYDVLGMPSGYLLDREGVVRKVHTGFRRGDEIKLRDEIKALLRQ